MKKIYRGMQNAAEDIQTNFDELIATLGVKSKTVYDGAQYFNESSKVYYNLAKNEVLFAIGITWSRYSVGGTVHNYGYNHQTILASNLVDGSTYLPIANNNGKSYMKSVNVNSTYIQGNDYNQEDIAKEFVCRQVEVYYYEK